MIPGCTWHRYFARRALQKAIRDGFLVRRPCSKCGSTWRVAGHHSDYSQPLFVQWLCCQCHALLHGKMNRVRKPPKPRYVPPRAAPFSNPIEIVIFNNQSLTLAQIAKIAGCSRERVRQIEARMIRRGTLVIGEQLAKD